MNTYSFTTTDLKHNTGEIINLVAYEKADVSIKRHGKIIATIIPAKVTPIIRDFTNILKKYSGSLPAFPNITQDRTQNPHRFDSQL
ncbi:hypothetical protein A2W24_06625 [Microgenomates group bacterium RBG_16_45_19]|nr:MAG: hypothetical protein A2W24_06625 [Microgenomates group bacterium RBG_16_45_19]